MEIVKTTEEMMVLQCLEQMLARAQDQMQNNSELSKNDVWKEHVQVISRAIHSTRVNMLETDMY